jgi:pantoate--beta-alanine ligase
MDLALSSRNNFLSNSERNDSSIIYKSLIRLKNNFNTSNLISTKKEIKNNINKKKNFQLEYLEIADASTLKIQSKINPKNSYRAFICVRVNDIRLIDNILLN